MNNLTTTTESLPKTGHVNEVCKEWLVREDGALAYKLQSQEINDFYKGNRQRNAVVREDFPTALNEQIKEQENAQKQAEAYRRRLTEQEEHDKRVAKEIADKLERDIQEQQQRELQESEAIAQRMQEIYVNMPPIPPPVARDKTRPPPRPAKASTLQQSLLTNEQQLPTTSNAVRHNKQYNAHHQSQQQQHNIHQQQQKLQQNIQYFADSNGYVGLSVNLPPTPQRQKAQHTNTTANHLMVSDEPTLVQKEHQQTRNHLHQKQNGNAAQPQYRHQHSNSSTAASSATANASLSPSALINACSPSTSSSVSTSAMRRNNVFDFINVNPQQQTHQQSPNSPKTPIMHQHSKSPKHPAQSTKSSPHSPISPAQVSITTVEELVDYSDVADSIRRYDIDHTPNKASFTNHIDTSDSPSRINRLLSPSHENLLSSNEKSFQKLSPEKYDHIMGNAENEAVGGTAAGGNGRSIEQHMQQHADDIELYADPCDYESLKEIGLPMEEIKELSKKLKQEQKDALLARKLQEMESGEKLSQEERDRMLAIEAQDKELAKMLQEREKAKAKRAKEKARLRKNQQQKDQTGCGSTSGLHCGPLLPLPQDCMSSLSSSGSSKQRVPITNSPPYTSAQRHQPQLQTNEDLLDMEAYSNPIDVINNQLQQQQHHQQQRQNGLLTNGSLTRDGGGGMAGVNAARHLVNNSHDDLNSRDDDIYTLPVDSCRPTVATTGNQRPASLIIGAEAVTGQTQHNSMTRSENYSLDSHGSLNGYGHDIPPRISYSKSVALDQNPSPTPPYMPIQGTRRSHSGEERKKKSKDKCTHQ